MTPPPPAAPDFLLDRDASWLAFHARVLAMAADPRTPLLERLGFLAICTTNLDEFFQKRMGHYRLLAEKNPAEARPKMAAIRAMVLPMLDEQGRIWHEVAEGLAAERIHILAFHELDKAERAHCRALFRSDFFPVLTPLAVDPAHPFPFISNLSSSLGVMLTHPGRPDEDPLFARVKIPLVLPAFVRLPGDADTWRFVPSQEIIRAHLGELFEGLTVREVLPFRITRSVLPETEGEAADHDDLLEQVSSELRSRRFADAVRLEVEGDLAAPGVVAAELDLQADDIYPAPLTLKPKRGRAPALLDGARLWELHRQCHRPDLKWPAFTPAVTVAPEEDLFAALRRGDLLVHHPFESFDATVGRFISAACHDPHVLAVKMTLYRTSEESPFIRDLILAAEARKQVVAVVELKARFDEERNVRLAQTLEKHGVHVVYGVVGLKTHTKTTLVVRREEDGRVRCYGHIGTGNYNPKTARLYTDLGLLTADPAITDDLVELFHLLTGRSEGGTFRQLLVAPRTMRPRFVEMIEREAAHAAAWKARGADPADPQRPAITAKMNQLEDRAIMAKLVEAAQAGVRVELLVRGFCCLRPGVAGLTDNIRVQSTLGRFLEHSRIYRFANAGQPEHFIGSADWMHRNLDARVECVTPVLAPAAKQKLDHILAVMLADRRQTWDLGADGLWTPRSVADLAADDPAARGPHAVLMK